MPQPLSQEMRCIRVIKGGADRIRTTINILDLLSNILFSVLALYESLIYTVPLIFRIIAYFVVIRLLCSFINRCFLCPIHCFQRVIINGENNMENLTNNNSTISRENTGSMLEEIELSESQRQTEVNLIVTN